MYSVKNSMDKVYDWKDKTILIAEDADDNFFLLTAILRKTGINLLRAKDGQEAVEIGTSNQNIDAILMDLSMPVMNGLEATKLIKNVKPDIPVIAQTAYAMETDRAHSLEAGCDDYISKPIRRVLLLEILNKFLNK